MAALIAERSGADKEVQATLFANTLNALTSSDRLGFDIAKERRSIVTDLQTANLEDFESAYLGEIDTSDFIKEITNHLSFLGMAITLGLEATHQKETGKGGLKEKALDFFTNKYLRKREKLTEKGDHIRPEDFQDITRET